MYRMPYSLHEKSGLVSLPIPVGKILTFDKKDATPEKVKPELAFLDSTKSVPNEASRLVVQAYDFKPSIGKDEKSGFQKDFEELPEAIPEEMFPPCIIKMLVGLGAGRKRALQMEQAQQTAPERSLHQGTSALPQAEQEKNPSAELRQQDVLL